MEENLVINNVKSMNHFKLHNIITKDNKAGNIIKFIDIKSKFFDKFGEIYFSEVNYKMIKGWKLHKQMQMNICVPAGEVKFVLFCNEKFNEIIMNKKSYILKKMNNIPRLNQFDGDKRQCLLNKCGLPDIPETSHCFNDATHHTCCY